MMATSSSSRRAVFTFTSLFPGSLARPCLKLCLTMPDGSPSAPPSPATGCFLILSLKLSCLPISDAVLVPLLVKGRDTSGRWCLSKLFLLVFFSAAHRPFFWGSFSLGELLLTQVQRWTKISSPSNCLYPFILSDLLLFTFLPSSHGGLSIIPDNVAACEPMLGTRGEASMISYYLCGFTPTLL